MKKKENISMIGEANAGPWISSDPYMHQQNLQKVTNLNQNRSRTKPGTTIWEATRSENRMNG